MTNTTLTNDEKRCLQMWFRQALAQVEREEVMHRLMRERDLDAKVAKVGSQHRESVSRRRAPRVAKTVHAAVKELVC